MQKYVSVHHVNVNLVDLVNLKSFPTNIFLQNLASIQKRTSPIKFAHLADKSGKGSISNPSTKVAQAEAELEADQRALAEWRSGRDAELRRLDEELESVAREQRCAFRILKSERPQQRKVMPADTAVSDRVCRR